MKIIFDNVNYFYPDFFKKKLVLNEINFKSLENECITVIGASGSGKTTFIKNINGLLFPTCGKIIIDNLEINKKNIFNIRKKIGYLTQNVQHQLFCQTVIEEVMYGPLNFGFSKQEAYKNSVESLKIFNIDEDMYKKYPLMLSGGEQKKIALASIISYNPKLILLDEPTSSMDVSSTKKFINFVKKIKKEKKIKIIIITHDMNLVNEISDRCILFNDGKIIYDGNPFKLFQNRKFSEENNLDIPDIFKLQHILYENNKIPNLYKDKFNINDIIRDYGEINE